MFDFEPSNSARSMFFIERTQRDRLGAGFAVAFIYNHFVNDIVSFIVNEFWEERSYKSVRRQILDINVSIDR